MKNNQQFGRRLHSHVSCQEKHQPHPQSFFSNLVQQNFLSNIDLIIILKWNHDILLNTKKPFMYWLDKVFKNNNLYPLYISLFLNFKHFFSKWWDGRNDTHCDDDMAFYLKLWSFYGSWVKKWMMAINFLSLSDKWLSQKCEG